MDLNFNSKLEEYYKKFIELQEKLKRSEEQRFILEMKFNEIAKISREEEQAHYRKLRAQYKKFLEEDQKRQERNERIIRNLERIEMKISMLSAKTDRINMFRRQYQNCLRRISNSNSNGRTSSFTPSRERSFIKEGAMKERQQTSFRDDYSIPEIPKEVFGKDRTYFEHPTVKKSLEKDRSNEEKIEILDRYLQSLSSQKCQERATEKLTKNFPSESIDSLSRSSNKATEVADDIMNSIYSRYYEKSEILPKGLKSDMEDKAESNSQKFGNNVHFDDSKACNASKQSGVDLRQLNGINTDAEKTSRKENDSDTYLVNNNSKSGQILEEEHEAIKIEPTDICDTAETKESKVVFNQDCKADIEVSVIHNCDNLETKEDLSKIIENDVQAQKSSESNCDEQNLLGISIFDELLLNTEKENTSDKKPGGEMIKNMDKTDLSDVYSGNKVLNEAQNETDNYFDNVNSSAQLKEDPLDVKDDSQSHIKHDSDLNLYQADQQEMKNLELGNQKEYPNSDQQYEQRDILEQQGELLKQQETKEIHLDPPINNVNHEEMPSRSNYETFSAEEPQHYDQNSRPFQYQPDQLQRLEYPEGGQAIGYAQDDPSNQHIQYEENGHLVQYQPDQLQRREYPESGQATGYAQDDASNQHIQYEENGQPVQYQPDQLQRLEYPEEGGQAIGYAQDDPSNQQIQYEENGQPVQYEQNQQPTIYDENGDLLQYDENQQGYDQYGQPVLYDQNGQIAQLQYDENGQIMPQYDEHGQMIMLFDQNGQQVFHEQSVLQLDENNQPIYDQNQYYDYANSEKVDQSHLYDQYQVEDLGQYKDPSGQQNNPQETDECQANDVSKEVVNAEQNVSETTENPVEDRIENHEESPDVIINDSEKDDGEKEMINNDDMLDKPANVMDILDTDTESVKQNISKLSNDSDFDFS